MENKPVEVPATPSLATAAPNELSKDPQLQLLRRTGSNESKIVGNTSSAVSSEGEKPTFRIWIEEQPPAVWYMQRKANLPQNSDIVLRVRVAEIDDERLEPPPLPGVELGLSAQLLYENYKPVEGGHLGGRLFRLAKDSDPMCKRHFVVLHEGIAFLRAIQAK